MADLNLFKNFLQLDFVGHVITREDRIRELAHKKWEEAGQPEGRDVEFWLEAEQEILNGTKSN